MQFVMLPITNFVWLFLFNKIHQYLERGMKKNGVFIIPLAFIQRVDFQVSHWQTTKSASVEAKASSFSICNCGLRRGGLMGREMSGPPKGRRAEGAATPQWGGAKRSRERSERVPLH
ncbi:MAG: hypothetical protein KAX24_06705 [Anaerolineae bacterium]|nr:hypothetical protein [Anaerolineae bacterium]